MCVSECVCVSLSVSMFLSQIFGIAFTEDADFELIQSLAQNTDGEYYRALKAEDLNNVFSRVHVLINKRPEPEPVPEPVVTQPEYVQPPPPPPVIAPPPPVIIEVPVQPQGMDAEERKRTMLILVALTVLIIAVIVMVIMLIRGARKKDGDDFVQEANFNDVNGYTSQPAYKLSGKPTMLGRVAGKDTDHLDYIVVPETTIGRRHALIEYKDYAYWIVDQGSINGTFVNDQLVSSEIRLKHGDRVRLHKCEFEFSLPEDVDAGMTQISKTVLASQPVGADKDVTVARDMPEGSDIDIPDSAFDLDITGSIDDDDSETPTEIRGSSGESGNTEFNGDETIDGDETIMLDSNNDTESSDDYDDEDATIRPDEVDDLDR